MTLQGTATIETFALRGVDAVPVTVEVELLRRLPATVILLVGEYGSGKTLLARHIADLLPLLSMREAAVEVARIHDAAGLLTQGTDVNPARMTTQPPFRAPHHTILTAGLLGNVTGRPGEATLAHHGVRVNRATGVYRLPAAFQLIAAVTPDALHGAPAHRLIDHPLLHNAVIIEVTK